MDEQVEESRPAGVDQGRSTTSGEKADSSARQKEVETMADDGTQSKGGNDAAPTANNACKDAGMPRSGDAEMPLCVKEAADDAGGNKEDRMGDKAPDAAEKVSEEGSVAAGDADKGAETAGERVCTRAGDEAAVGSVDADMPAETEEKLRGGKRNAVESTDEGAEAANEHSSTRLGDEAAGDGGDAVLSMKAGEKVGAGRSAEAGSTDRVAKSMSIPSSVDAEADGADAVMLMDTIEKSGAGRGSAKDSTGKVAEATEKPPTTPSSVDAEADGAVAVTPMDAIEKSAAGQSTEAETPDKVAEAANKPASTRSSEDAEVGGADAVALMETSEKEDAGRATETNSTGKDAKAAEKPVSTRSSEDAEVDGADAVTPMETIEKSGAGQPIEADSPEKGTEDANERVGICPGGDAGVDGAVNDTGMEIDDSSPQNLSVPDDAMKPDTLLANSEVNPASILQVTRAPASPGERGSATNCPESDHSGKADTNLPESTEEKLIDDTETSNHKDRMESSTSVTIGDAANSQGSTGSSAPANHTDVDEGNDGTKVAENIPESAPVPEISRECSIDPASHRNPETASDVDKSEMNHDNQLSRGNPETSLNSLPSKLTQSQNNPATCTGDVDRDEQGNAEDSMDSSKCKNISVPDTSNAETEDNPAMRETEAASADNSSLFTVNKMEPQAAEDSESDELVNDGDLDANPAEDTEMGKESESAFQIQSSEEKDCSPSKQTAAADNPELNSQSSNPKSPSNTLTLKTSKDHIKRAEITADGAEDAMDMAEKEICATKGKDQSDSVKADTATGDQVMSVEPEGGAELTEKTRDVNPGREMETSNSSGSKEGTKHSRSLRKRSASPDVPGSPANAHDHEGAANQPAVTPAEDSAEATPGDINGRSAADGARSTPEMDQNQKPIATTRSASETKSNQANGTAIKTAGANEDTPTRKRTRKGLNEDNEVGTGSPARAVAMGDEEEDVAVGGKEEASPRKRARSASPEKPDAAAQQPAAAEEVAATEEAAPQTASGRPRRARKTSQRYAQFRDSLQSQSRASRAKADAEVVDEVTPVLENGSPAARGPTAKAESETAKETNTVEKNKSPKIPLVVVSLPRRSTRASKRLGKGGSSAQKVEEKNDVVMISSDGEEEDVDADGESKEELTPTTKRMTKAGSSAKTGSESEEEDVIMVESDEEQGDRNDSDEDYVQKEPPIPKVVLRMKGAPVTRGRKAGSSSGKPKSSQKEKLKPKKTVKKSRKRLRWKSIVEEASGSELEAPEEDTPLSNNQHPPKKRRSKRKLALRSRTEKMVTAEDDGEEEAEAVAKPAEPMETETATGEPESSTRAFIKDALARLKAADASGMIEDPATVAAENELVNLLLTRVGNLERLVDELHEKATGHAGLMKDGNVDDLMFRYSVESVMSAAEEFVKARDYDAGAIARSVERLWETPAEDDAVGIEDAREQQEAREAAKTMIWRAFQEHVTGGGGGGN